MPKKDWTDILMEKLDSYNARKSEINTALNDLKLELELKHRTVYMQFEMVDKEKLVWKIGISNQQFLITEEEIAKKQIIEGANDYGDIIDTGQRISVKESLKIIIIEKIKSV